MLGIGTHGGDEPLGGLFETGKSVSEGMPLFHSGQDSALRLVAVHAEVRGHSKHA